MEFVQMIEDQIRVASLRGVPRVATLYKHRKNRVRTRLRFGQFTLNRNWSTLPLPANLFLFPGTEKSWCAILSPDLESVLYTGRHTQVGSHCFPVDGSMPAHETWNLFLCWSRISSALNQLSWVDDCFMSWGFERDSTEASEVGKVLRFRDLAAIDVGVGRLFEIDRFMVLPVLVIVRVDRRNRCFEDWLVSLFEDVCPANDKRAETLRGGADSQLSYLQ